MNIIDVSPQQRARSHLRANFLYGLCELNGEPCNLTTFEETTLSGVFKGWKTDGAEFLIRGLQTPTGENMNTALMRTNDIICIEFTSSIILPTRCKVKADTDEDLRGR